MKINDYLAELERNLRVGPLAKRRILREIETHLEDAVRHEEEAGASPEQAEQRALERLGSEEVLTAHFGTTTSRRRWLLPAGVALVISISAALAITVGPKGERASQPDHLAISRPRVSNQLLISSTGDSRSRSTVTITARITKPGKNVPRTMNCSSAGLGTITVLVPESTVITCAGNGSPP